jgi:hypothetical protein
MVPVPKNRLSKVVQMKANINLQRKMRIKGTTQGINLLHPDGKTPYGWAFEIFYDAKEKLKNLSNRNSKGSVIGTEEFNSFSNLTTKWIPDSDLGQNLWVIRNESSLSGVEKCFPMEAHTAFGNKIVRGVVYKNILKGSNMVVKDVKLTKEEMNDMNY